jgi:hypothetical protein
MNVTAQALPTPGQALCVWPLLPIRPGKLADNPADGADHVRAEPRHRHIGRQRSAPPSWWQVPQTTHNERTPCGWIAGSGCGVVGS